MERIKLARESYVSGKLQKNWSIRHKKCGLDFGVISFSLLYHIVAQNKAFLKSSEMRVVETIRFLPTKEKNVEGQPLMVGKIIVLQHIGRVEYRETQRSWSGE